ncbi:MAG: hypothetical protein K0R61_4060 [Microvirga sp.]|nr:hypothetical protein [Microvirga sp.]
MSSAVLVQTNGSGCRLLAAVRTMIRIVFRHHPKNNVIELVVSVTGSEHTSWSASDLIHSSDIVDVLAEQI